MTLERFQGIVLKLGNQMFVRHYLWLNYPNEPQRMGVDLIGQQPYGRKRLSSCDCGACAKCRHRDYMRAKRPKNRLAVELEESGFVFDRRIGMWTVERQL